TIVFGTGTIQKFKRIGPARGAIHRLEHGVFALVDEHFILVDGEAKGGVTGYGTYTHAGPAYDLKIVRWAGSSGANTAYQKDSHMKASFDGSTLTLADGRSMRVTK